jgi:hypothetical protein
LKHCSTTFSPIWPQEERKFQMDCNFSPLSCY